jgi:hypothetical protein
VDAREPPRRRATGTSRVLAHGSSRSPAARSGHHLAPGSRSAHASAGGAAVDVTVRRCGRRADQHRQDAACVVAANVTPYYANLIGASPPECGQAEVDVPLACRRSPTLEACGLAADRRMPGMHAHRPPARGAQHTPRSRERERSTHRTQSVGRGRSIRVDREDRAEAGSPTFAKDRSCGTADEATRLGPVANERGAAGRVAFHGKSSRVRPEGYGAAPAVKVRGDTRCSRRRPSDDGVSPTSSSPSHTAYESD